jgi:hypothetical protein
MVDRALVDTPAPYVTPDKTAEIERRLNRQAEWATGVERQLTGLAAFKSAHAVDLNKINTDLARLQTELDTVCQQAPFAVEELAARLDTVFDALKTAREAELLARQALRDQQESYDLAVAFALSSANGAVDGKNEESRKVAKTTYLANHEDVKREKMALDAAQLRSEEAVLAVRTAEDEFSATRAVASLTAAQLTYLGGK